MTLRTVFLLLVWFPVSGVLAQSGDCTGQADGTPCSDGNACTYDDACSAGSCQGTVIACADDQCAWRTCNGTAACTVLPFHDGRPCDDGNACSTGDHCSDGACLAGPPTDCDSGHRCTVNPCDPVTGCIIGPARSCDDRDPCTADICDPFAGCIHNGLAEGAACDDGHACTYHDLCHSGFCSGTPITCGSDACAARECNGTAKCSVVPAADATVCDDGNACTAGDACAAGGCVAMLVSDGLRVAKLDPDDTSATLAWTLAPGATASDVIRGLIGALPVGGNAGAETCLAASLPAAELSWADGELPAVGGCFWYLVRGRNDCGFGPLGFQAQDGLASAPRISNACP